MRIHGVPPPGSEPIVRVGIVLPEDKLREIHFQVPVEGYSLMNSERCIPLHPAQTYIMQNKDSSLRLSSKKVAHMLVSSEPLCIRGPRNSEVAKDSEIFIEGIPYMREGTRRKSLDMSFPGTIEFHPHISYLSVTNSLRLEFFTTCATLSETTAICAPSTLKAMSITIRSRVLTEHAIAVENGQTIQCNCADGMRYYGSTYVSSSATRTIAETAGMFLTDSKHQVFPARYSTSCGGVFELPHDDTAEAQMLFDAPEAAQVVLPKSLTTNSDAAQWVEASSLRGAGVYCSPERIRESSLTEYIPTPGELDACFRWIEFVATREIEHNLRKKFQIHDLESIINVQIAKRSVSGRVAELVINYNSSAQIPRSFTATAPLAIRSVLHQHALKSTSFTITPTGPEGEAPAAYRIEGAGEGRGLSLCKIGSIGMGLLEKSTEDILQHYFPECSTLSAYRVS